MADDDVKRNEPADEVGEHLELERLRLMRTGTPAEEAGYAARRAFGNVTAVRERLYEGSHRGLWLERILLDVRFALRSLRKSPRFTVMALVTLMLGIGSSTAIFSVANAVLLKPLPYADPSRLMIVWSDMTARNVRDFPIAPADLPDMREQGTRFAALGAVNTFRAPFHAPGNAPEQIRMAGVTTNFFSLLGVRMAAGRDFQESDGAAPPQPPPAAPGAAQPPPVQLTTMIILGHDFWLSRFGGDSAAIGKVVDIFGGKGEIVGVLPANFALLFPPRASIEARNDLYIANRIDFATASRVNVFMRVVGRLKAGETRVAAQQQFDAVATDLRTRFPIKETAGLRFRVEAMSEDLVSDIKPVIAALLGAVLSVLLIACANVANLLLVRSSLRERELTVRAAMGADQWSLVRQLLAESFVLAAGGAVLGVALASGGIVFLGQLAPPSLPRADDITLDLTVLAFAILISLVSAVAFGLVPAIRASKPDLADALRSTGRAWALGAGRRLRHGVVMAEVALSFVLLIGAGLMMRSVIELQRVDPGYDPSSLLTFQVGPQQVPTFGERAAWMQMMKERLAAIPGVTAVTGANPMPLADAALTNNARWGPMEAANNTALFQQANAHIVQPGYFEMMRARLIDGRTFIAADNDSASMSVIIDDLLAAKAFPGVPAVGRQLLIRVRGPQPETWNVVGVVQHQRHEGLATPGREAIFFTDAAFGFGAANRWALRTSVDPSSIGGAVRAAVAAVDPKLAIGELRPMEYYIDRAMAPTRFALLLIGIFAGVAIVLTAIGLYGVLATVVRQRTAEIGVRMALGASRSSIVGMIVGQGFRLSVLGVAAGIVGAFAATRLIGALLVGVKPTDPMTFVAMVALFFAVASVASYLPALRAASLDPNAALRDE